MGIIEVAHLKKRYRNRLAVDDLSFSVAQGEILGVLGPNGAGKSSTLRMLTGFLAPTAGTLRIDGLDLLSSPLAAKGVLGYLPEVPPLYPELSVQGFLSFVARLKGLSGQKCKEEVDRVSQATGCHEVKGRLIQNLSRGFRQRVGLAQALLNAPKVLVLDEPTEGLDPRQRTQMLQLIKGLAPRHTVVLSTHVLSEIKAVCDRVLILNGGRKVADDSLAQLTVTFGSLEEAFLQLTQA
jgi:ABC-2 type transport system ATP-binding protein